jgi:hypothetical protein
MKGWLDNFGKADNANDSKVSMSEDFVGLGYNTKGRNYSPAWGGQFQKGGNLLPSQQILGGGQQSTIQPTVPYLTTKDPAEFYKSWIQSPEYEQRLKSTGYSDVPDRWNPDKLSEIERVKKQRLNFLENIQPFEYNKYKKSEADPFAIGGPTININPLDYEGSARQSIEAHEIAHVGTPTMSYQESEIIRNAMLPMKEPVLSGVQGSKERDASRRALEDFKHLQKPEEAKADLDALRFMMYDKGIYDITKGQKFTESDFEKAKQNLGKDRVFERLENRMGKKNFVKLMNTIASADSEELPMAMGGMSIPGSVGFTYARTAGSAPSEGKYAKKTMASAQNGQEMKFYQSGLDWKPKSMQDGGEESFGKKLTNFVSEGISGPVTEKALGLLDMVKPISNSEIYKTIRPVGYPNALRLPMYAYDYLMGNESEPLKTKSGKPHLAEEFWATAMGMPIERQYLKESKYKPSVAKDPDAKYYTIRDIIDDYDLMNLTKDLKPGEKMEMNGLLPILDSKWYSENADTDKNVKFGDIDPLQRFTLQKSPDGSYVSIYDKYDFNNPALNKMMNPIEIYDRFYLPKKKNGGSVNDKKNPKENKDVEKISINDPRYPELYKNRQVGLLYDGTISLPDLDEVTVTAPRSYTMDSLRDFTTAALYGAPANAMKLSMIPQAAMTEGIEALRGKPYDFSNVNPNFGGFASNQRDLSQTMGYENPEGFLQNAINFGLSAIDPAMIVGLTKNPVKNLTRTFTDNLNYSKSINPTRYVAGDEIKPAFGYATRNNETVVRGDLPEKVKNFVQAHEDYHVYDFQKYPNSSDSFFRRELPANFFPALKNPIGFASTVKHSLTPERLSFYKKRLKENFKTGGVIKDNMGQWAHPGKVTEIDSNYITMEGVPYNVVGVSDAGDTKLMKPGKNYKFKGKKVTEYPVAKLGINQLDAQPMKKLNQLLNFTNNPDKNNWLDKYN